jgi:hypothetical protein
MVRRHNMEEDEEWEGQEEEKETVMIREGKTMKRSQGISNSKEWRPAQTNNFSVTKLHDFI